MLHGAWVLGYHGCDREVGESVLRGDAELKVSENAWDWLGSGIYLWENSPRRALAWARSVAANPKLSAAAIEEPFVVGAIVQPSNVLDLLDPAAVETVRQGYAELSTLFHALGTKLPVNRGTPPDNLIRRLDCAVINYLHDARQQAGKLAYDTVRAAFVEGPPIYEGAGFHDRTHIQLCVRSAAQIIGYFRVKEDALREG